MIADSVEARHILIPFSGATRVDPSVTRSPMEAKALADSLFDYLSSNRSAFEDISNEFSSDVVAKGKGGSLGYFKRGMMAKPFENFCFFNEGYVTYVTHVTSVTHPNLFNICNVLTSAVSSNFCNVCNVFKHLQRL
jgi:hypothetical protein